MPAFSSKIMTPSSLPYCEDVLYKTLKISYSEKLDLLYSEMRICSIALKALAYKNEGLFRSHQVRYANDNQGNRGDKKRGQYDKSKPPIFIQKSNEAAFIKLVNRFRFFQRLYTCAQIAFNTLDLENKIKTETSNATQH